LCLDTQYINLVFLSNVEKQGVKIKTVRFLAIVAISCISFADIAQAENPSFETISRCFFIYASVIQSGEKLPHPELYQFGLGRVGWIGGYVQASQTNIEFKRIFEANLAENKRAGKKLEQSLMAAVISRNQIQFSNDINEAINCDRLIGITTKFIPKM
jgi:hypothetical protein